MYPLLVETRGLQLLKVSGSPLPPVCGAQICVFLYISVGFLFPRPSQESQKLHVMRDKKMTLPPVPPEKYFWKERSILNWTWILVQKVRYYFLGCFPDNSLQNQHWWHSTFTYTRLKVAGRLSAKQLRMSWASWREKNVKNATNLIASAEKPWNTHDWISV